VGNPIETLQPPEDNGAGPLPNGWRRQCGAKTRDGTPCRRPPLAGRRRCRLHGGATPSGLGSPHWKHGRYSKVVPRGLRQAYEEAARDPELLSLRRDLALLQAFEVELLKRLSEGPPPRGRLVKAYKRVLAAGNDAAEQQAALAELGALLAGGEAAKEDYERTWRRLRKLFQEKAQVVLVEARRLHNLDQYLTKEQAAALGHLVMCYLRDAVLDEATFARGPRAVLRKAQDGLRAAMEGAAPTRQVIDGDAAGGELPCG
jgi:hypothetical protein